MRRVVITGLGVVSSLGNNCQEVSDSLHQGKSGIENIPEYKELGFRSHVAGTVNIDTEALIDRKLRRFMGNSAAYNYIAMQEAIDQSGLADDMISNVRTGLIAGSCFLLGAFLSLFSGFIGMKAATYANVRTSECARGGSKPNALLTALDGGQPDRLPVTTHHLMPYFFETYLDGISEDEFFDREVGAHGIERPTHVLDGPRPAQLPGHDRLAAVFVLELDRDRPDRIRVTAANLGEPLPQAH